MKIFPEYQFSFFSSCGCEWIEAESRRNKLLAPLEDREFFTCCVVEQEKMEKMGGILLQHHQISPNYLAKAAFPGSFALHKGDSESVHSEIYTHALIYIHKHK